MGEEGRRHFNSLRQSWGAVLSSAEANQDSSRNAPLVSEVPSLIVLLGLLLRRLKRSFRFKQLNGLEEEQTNGNKENPLYFAELNIVLPIERKISPCLPLALPLQGSCENAVHNGVIKQKP